MGLLGNKGIVIVSYILSMFVVLASVVAQAELPQNFQYQIEVELEDGFKFPLAEVCFELEQDTITASDSAYDFDFQVEQVGITQFDGVLTPSAAIADRNNPFSVPFAVACRSALNFIEEFQSLVESGQYENDFFNQPFVDMKWEVSKYLMSSLITYFEEVSKISNRKRLELNKGSLGFREAMLLMTPGFILSDSSKFLIAKQARVIESMANYRVVFDTPAVFDTVQIETPIFRQRNSEDGGFAYYTSAPLD